MASTWIVKIAQENSDAPVLLHLTQKGDKDLDLDLVGTEGEAVYHGKGGRTSLLISFLSVSGVILRISQFAGERLPHSNQTMQISKRTSLRLFFATG